MGLAKSYYMEQQERDYSEVESEEVCNHCLTEENCFSAFFKKNAKLGKCNYCKKTKKVTEINDLIKFISQRVFMYYSNPVEYLPYESKEGGFHGAKMRYMDDILESHISFNKHKLKETITSAFDGSERYCEVDPFSDRDSDIFKGYWDKFVQIVKYEVRFFFPRPDKSRTTKIKLGEIKYAGDILNFSQHEMKMLKLFKTINLGQVIYRARKEDEYLKNPFDVLEYQVPSIEVSAKISNRLSPAGIPIFYGAFNKEHLASEVRAKDDQNLYIAEFQLLKPITVLDLTLLEAPSIFKDDNGSYEGKRFIQNFIDDIMTPVEHDGKQHLEYVPSQVFSEFIRHRVKHKGKKIDGIIFPSSFNPFYKNIALFISNSDFCLDTNSDKEMLKFIEIKKFKIL